MDIHTRTLPFLPMLWNIRFGGALTKLAEKKEPHDLLVNDNTCTSVMKSGFSNYKCGAMISGALLCIGGAYFYKLRNK
tara:strand:+ start:38 stop:271 length:234 start_codon:yes stop_codon:yes gene_type:complete